MAYLEDAIEMFLQQLLCGNMDSAVDDLIGFLAPYGCEYQISLLTNASCSDASGSSGLRSGSSSGASSASSGVASGSLYSMTYTTRRVLLVIGPIFHMGPSRSSDSRGIILDGLFRFGSGSDACGVCSDASGSSGWGSKVSAAGSSFGWSGSGSRVSGCEFFGVSMALGFVAGAGSSS